MVNIYDSLPSGYEYLKINDTQFRIAGIKDAQSAKKWIHEFSIVTKSTWRVTNTAGSRGKKFEFRTCYKCVLNPGVRNYQGRPSTKPTKQNMVACPAKMRVTVKTSSVKWTLSEDDLSHEWPCLIQFTGTHNHGLEESLKYRDLSDETKEKMVQLFRLGFPARAAHNSLVTDLMLEHGTDYEKVAADRHYLPSCSTVEHFYKTWVSKNGAVDAESTIINMGDMLAKYNKEGGGKANYFSSKDNMHYFVVVCTPIMAKAHSLWHARESVTLEGFWGAAPTKNAGRKPKGEVVTMEKHQLMMYFITTTTQAGELPLGLIVTDTDDLSIFEEAMSKLMKILPKNSFGGQKFPNTFLTDSRLSASLKRLFPHSSAVMCQAQFLKQVWTWLCDPMNRIHNDDRHGLYCAVKKVLRAPNVRDMERCHSELLGAGNTNKYQDFISYYCLALWHPMKDTWGSNVQNGTARACNSTVEVVFTYLRHCLLKKITALGLAPLVFYMVTQYESYVRRGLVEFSQGTFSFDLMLSTVSYDGKVLNVQPVGDSQDVFSVSGFDNSKAYTLDLSSGVCSCCYGQTGRFCSHAAAVLTLLSPEIESSFSKVSPAIKAEMYIVARASVELYQVASASVKSEAPAYEPSSTTCEDDSDYNDSDASFDEVDVEMHKPKKANLMTLEYIRESKKRKDVQENSCKEEVKKRRTRTPTPELSAEENDKFDSFVQRVKDGLASDPKLFVPAIRGMLLRLDQDASSDTDLAAALSCFGKQSKDS